MSKLYFTILFLLFSLLVIAQLKPAINSGKLAPLSARVEKMKCSTSKADMHPDSRKDSNITLTDILDEYIVSGGYTSGDTAPDFTLYDTSGKGISLATIMQKHKPVLLISGSYSCFVLRDRIHEINYLRQRYKDSIVIAVIYLLEAHPYQSKGYYTCSNNIGFANTRDSVYVRQAATLAERMVNAKRLVWKTKLNARVLIDDERNSWLKNYGQGPNMAYLIDTNGVIVKRQDWFNKAPAYITYDIDKLLGHAGNSRVSTGGTFEILSYKNSAKGIQKTGIMGDLKISNPSSEGVWLSIIKRNYLPYQWTSFFCADACYKPEVNTIHLYLAPNTIQYVYVQVNNPSLALGSVFVTVKNDSTANDTTQVKMDFYSIDKFPPAYIGKVKALEIETIPETGSVYLEGIIPQLYTMTIYNDQGRKALFIPREKMTQLVNLSILKPGHYDIWITGANGDLQHAEYYKPGQL